MTTGVEIREYLQNQTHTYITSEQAEALTVDLLKMIPITHTNVGVGSPPPEITYPLNARYVKPMLTRVRNAAQRRRDQQVRWLNLNPGQPLPIWLERPETYAPATVAKHERAFEIEKMYGEIARFRRMTGKMLG